MTAYKARINGEDPKGNNKKDGATGRRRRRNFDAWAEAGFVWVPGTPATYTFTWDGDFPVIGLSPGIVVDEEGAHAGMVAHYPEADIEIVFPYGTPPTDIAARLNDEILAIMRHDAELIESPLDWVDVDDWMTRPQEAARQSTRAAREMADTHNINLRTAGEFLLERGE
ncbi:MAG: hypothetical protein ACYTEW_24385 [Planctomycetota bacterium]|jgi:hypothetical protein